MTPRFAGVVALLLLGGSERATAERIELSRTPAAPSAERVLRCGDDACSPSVGWLVRETAGDTISCTAFLVQPDLVATARHCVATTRRDGSRDAPSRFALVFADGASFAAETHEARVVRTSSDAGVSIQSESDWALLELDHASNRPPLDVERAGVADATEVIVPSIRLAGEQSAVLTTSRCATAQHSLFAPHIDDDRAPVQVLAGCDVGRGSSGAPVIDHRGRAVAIVHASDQRTWPWREPLRFPLELAGASQSEPLPIAYASSFACVDLDGSGVTTESCDAATWVARTHRPGDAAARFARELLDRMTATIASEVGTTESVALARNPRESWTIGVIRESVHVRIAPSAQCVVSSDEPMPTVTDIAVVVGSNGTPTLRIERTELRGIETCPTDVASRVVRAEPARASVR